MKLHALLILLFINIGKSNIDGGLPTIQAVCRIELNNGEIHEGIISFGGGGYEWRYIPNGFYTKYSNSGYVGLFNLEYRSPDFDTKGESEIFYLENLTESRIGYEIKENGDSLLTRYYKESFKLHKKFPIYQSLPNSLYVGYDSTLSKKIIEVDKIASFELLEDPQQKWLDLIEEARKERQKVEDTWEDYNEPVWYHDVMKNEEYRELLMRYFPRE